MRKLEGFVLVVATVVLLAPAHASGKDAPSKVPPRRFGDSVTVVKAVDIAKLAKNPAKLEGRTVRIEGTVKEVCQGSGCWVEVRNARGSSFLARSLDHSVLLPTDCRDLPIVVQGVVTKLVPEETGEHESEGHVCPQPTWVVSMLAVELRDPGPAK